MTTGRCIAALIVFSAAAFARDPIDSNGKPVDPFASAAHANVFLFVRTDCPISNRYAPELQRIASEFSSRGVEFWLVYSDRAETAAGIATQIAQYKLPGKPLRDADHKLAARSQATVSPQAAVFDGSGKLVYTGRIDDQFVDFGKARQKATTHDLESAIAAVLSGRPVKFTKTRAVGCYLADVQ